MSCVYACVCVGVMCVCTQVIDMFGDPADEDSLEFSVRYDDHTREVMSLSDLQILIANGDTKKQAALAYDKDICQICLRADFGEP